MGRRAAAGAGAAGAGERQAARRPIRLGRGARQAAGAARRRLPALLRRLVQLLELRWVVRPDKWGVATRAAAAASARRRGAATGGRGGGGGRARRAAGAPVSLSSRQLGRRALNMAPGCGSCARVNRLAAVRRPLRRRARWRCCPSLGVQRCVERRLRLLRAGERAARGVAGRSALARKDKQRRTRATRRENKVKSGVLGLAADVRWCVRRRARPRREAALAAAVAGSCAAPQRAALPRNSPFTTAQQHARRVRSCPLPQAAAKSWPHARAARRDSGAGRRAPGGGSSGG
jgi:hypothetical protein